MTLPKTDSIKIKYPEAKNVCELIEMIVARYNYCYRPLPSFEKKYNEHITDYQNHGTMTPRSLIVDRVFPLETVEIQGFNRDYDTKIEYVNVHTGPFANEYTSACNALAITIANDIYFRNNKYNPTTEEGRELIAHELTHIKQHTEGKLNGNTSKDELENEAKSAESWQSHNKDYIVTAEIEGKLFKYYKSDEVKIASIAAYNIKRWMQKEKLIRSEDEYEQILRRFKTWVNEK